jgi:dienelactone hydrolase
MRKHRVRGSLSALFLAAFVASGALSGPAVLMPGPVNTTPDEPGRALWLLPSQDPGVPMLTTVFRPKGEGPFPMVLMSHGTTRNGVQRIYFPLLEFGVAAEWFAAQNYVVVAPQRPGHGDTGGPWYEDVVPCDHPQFGDAGLSVAEADAAGLDYMFNWPFVKREGVILVGQSAGGFGSLAYASQNPAGLRAMVNFAGGRTCAENPHASEDLVQVTAEFCRTVRIPMLWIYTQNDHFFPPEVSRPMYDACRTSGANVEYHLLPPFEDNGHFLIDVPAAIPIWAPIVTKFLAAHPRSH